MHRAHTLVMLSMAVMAAWILTLSGGNAIGRADGPAPPLTPSAVADPHEPTAAAAAPLPPASSPTPEPTPTATPIDEPPAPPVALANPGDVVINEVAWSGTQASYTDEWIELKNNTGTAITVTGWTLASDDGTPGFGLSGAIPPDGYFLLERSDDGTVSDVPADQVYSGLLSNDGETLRLFDDLFNVMDTANADGGPWPAGTGASGSPPYASMERTDPAGPDTAANWHSNDGLTRNGLDADGYPINGTPKSANSGPAPPPTPAALLISEVVYDGTTPSTEGDEFVEVFNPFTTTVDLTGYKVGDEETPGAGEGMYAFPAGTTIGPGACLVVARNAAQFRARFSFDPDFEMVTTGSGYTDTLTVPDLSRYTAWASGSWALANNGDEVLLVGPDDTMLDAVAYRAGDYAALGLVGEASAPAPRSLQRVADWDSDDMPADFAIDAPNPGQPTELPPPPVVPPLPAPLPGGMYGYFGCLHSHSTYSDGSGPPGYAYAVARANDLHFLALTDHSHRLNDVRWTDTLTQARAATVDGLFVGLRGFEWTSRQQGHLSVFDTGACVSRDVPPFDTLSGFYDWLAAQPQAIAQFNHPADEYGTNFDGLAYAPAVGENVALLEVGNSSGAAYRAYAEQYVRALSIGWQVGVANNGDTETPDWGADTPHRTGLVAPALAEADLLAALRARRTFATEDANLALALQADGAWMGSTVPHTASVAFSVTFRDPDAEPIFLELYDRATRVASADLSSSTGDTWLVSVPAAPGHFYFVRATQTDGDRAYTSPIRVEGTAEPETVVVNEFMPAPWGTDWDGDGVADGNDEWVELYNPGDDAIGLGGWQLDDGPGGSPPYVIPLGTHVEADGFLVLYHRDTGVALNNDDDWVRLLRPDGSVADEFRYGHPGSNQSWCRTEDGGGGWTTRCYPTPGGPNQLWPEPTESPPGPTPTPTPAPRAVSIAEVKALPSGSRVIITGQVTVPPPLFGEKTIYVQDATGGIMVYLRPGGFPPLAEGDWVEVWGRAWDYHGEREVQVYRERDVRRLGPGEPLSPALVHSGDVDEAHEGLLVQTIAPATGFGRDSITLDDGSGPARVYIRRTTGIQRPWVEVGQVFAVVGVVSQYAPDEPYEGGYRLLPRYQRDISQAPAFLPVSGGDE